MSIETKLNATIVGLIGKLTQDFGIELTPEATEEVISKAKKRVAKMEASRPKSTKKSKSKN